MVKFNTEQEKLNDSMAEFLGIILCGLLILVICGTLGLGVGLIFLNLLPACGLGLVTSVIGFIIGLRGGYKTVAQQKKDRE